LDRGDHLGMPVADRDVHELRGEVEVALPVVVPEVAPLRARDRDRVDRVLHGPRVEDVALCVLDDLLAQLGIGLDGGHGSPYSILGRGSLPAPMPSNPSRGRMGVDSGPALPVSRGVPRSPAARQRAWTSEVYAPLPRASGSVAPPMRMPPS